jgi:hypothetical protein
MKEKVLLVNQLIKNFTKKLHQVITAVNGVIRFKLEHHSGDSFEFILDSPEKCLYIPSGYWREIQFSHSAVLLCLASEKYEEEDLKKAQHYLKILIEYEESQKGNL